MTVILELKPKTERRLRHEAEQAGQEFSQYVATLLNDGEEDPDEEEGAEGSSYDLFAGKLGGIRSGGDGRKSKNTSEQSAIGDQVEKNKAALEVLRAWRKQNATDDPKEIERRQSDWEEFKTVLDEDRPSERKLFS